MIAALLIAAFSFVSAMAIGLVPFIGSRSENHRYLRTMTALAAGFLIGAALLIAVPEGLLLQAEFSVHRGQEDGGAAGYRGLGLSLLLGFLFMLIMETFGFSHDIHEEHHDHVDEHGHSHVNHPVTKVPYAVVGLTIHALIDGMIIGIALAQEALALSIALVISITMHKLPAAFSVSAFSLHERREPKHSLMDLLLFAASTPLAILLFYLLSSDISPLWQGYAMLFSAGTFLYVACVDVLPSIHETRRSLRVVWPVILGVVITLVIVALTETLVGHGH